MKLLYPKQSILFLSCVLLLTLFVSSVFPNLHEGLTNDEIIQNASLNGNTVVGEVARIRKGVDNITHFEMNKIKEIQTANYSGNTLAVSKGLNTIADVQNNMQNGVKHITGSIINKLV